MIYATVFFCIIALLTSAWTWYCAKWRPSSYSIILFAMALTICYFSAVELLGRPKPIEYELANYELETVLSYRIIRNESIFIWLKLVETEVPIAYVLPWSDRTVESLQNSFRDAGVGDAIKIEDQDFIENPNERETIFYVQPQKPRPPKSYDEEEQ